jgi:hypothetical protein
MAESVSEQADGTRQVVEEMKVMSIAVPGPFILSYLFTRLK